MLKYIIGFCIFCIVLFIYLHVQFHLKTSNHLEVYELENGSKDKLEEVCDLRQPIIMNFFSNAILKHCTKQYVLDNYHAFEMKIRNAKEEDYHNEIYVPLRLLSAFKLFDEDKTGSYITESNKDFITETGLTKIFQSEDEFIRPNLTSHCEYDFCTGSEDSTTPLRYEINYRNFFYVTSGEIEIKLVPPKYSKYLHSVEDYDNFEFRSPINPWSVQKSFQSDFDKIKYMDILLPVGKMIHIPAYWWYSLRYKQEATLVSFKYKTYMNTIAISPHIGMQFLQMQNVQHRIVKKYEQGTELERNVEEIAVEIGVTNIGELSSIPVENELPHLQATTHPVEEISIPLLVKVD
uniref:Cupin-like domain-containing protein n=1 Tax=viral metagenome TaxID=1070528 RepID=A0A6C0B9C4_9ZZZZ